MSAALDNPPPLPARPTTEPSGSPTKTPDLPPREPSEPLRQLPAHPSTRLPPTIPEDESISASSGHTPSLKYTRETHKLIVYAIPLPKPKFSKNEDALPERFLLYTPPQPHFLKPAKGVKEPKKNWGKRKLQEEVQKAKKYDGKTVSWRGLHSKTTKGVLWVVHRIRSTDIVFLGRVSKDVDEIVLVFPSSVTQTIPEVRGEFIAQITRTQRKAAKDTAISTVLLPVTLVIDTFAAVIWPFGGLFEIDAVWFYASAKGWNNSRVITKRLGARGSMFGKWGGTERDLHLGSMQNEKIEVLRQYLADCCHKKNPKMFDSEGVPPTEGKVMDAIGWNPVRRGKTGGERVKGVEGETGFAWADEEWQKSEFRDDFRATIEKGAGSWGKWCKKFEKHPDKMLKK